MEFVDSQEGSSLAMGKLRLVMGTCQLLSGTFQGSLCSPHIPGDSHCCSRLGTLGSCGPEAQAVETTGNRRKGLVCGSARRVLT